MLMWDGRDDKIQALVQRLSSLENSVQTTRAVSNIASTPDSSTTCNTDNLSQQPVSCSSLKRKRSRQTDDAESTAAAAADPSLHQATIAGILINDELSRNGLLSANQRHVLETALSFIGQISQAPSSHFEEGVTWDRNNAVDMDLSRSEILHILLGAQMKEPSPASLQLHLLDHIPPKEFEKIALALLQDEVDEQTRNLYKVIVHFKAAIVLCMKQVNPSTSPGILQEIKSAKMMHVQAALTALDRVSMLAPPSLLLLQAMITGVSHIPFKYRVSFIYIHTLIRFNRQCSCKSWEIRPNAGL
jgi:hypothetical protein